MSKLDSLILKISDQTSVLYLATKIFMAPAVKLLEFLSNDIKFITNERNKKKNSRDKLINNYISKNAANRTNTILNTINQEEVKYEKSNHNGK